MDKSEILRAAERHLQQALNCRSLLEMTRNKRAIRVLKELADQLEQRAAELTRQAAPFSEERSNSADEQPSAPTQLAALAADR